MFNKTRGIKMFKVNNAFTHLNIKEVREKVNEALETLKQYGIDAQIGNITYNLDEVRTKLVLRVLGTNPQETDFKKYATSFGLKPEDFGKTFNLNTKTMKIVGLSVKSKLPIICEDQHGKSFKVSEKAVLEGLKRF